jgi:hypothetical protein
MKTRYLFATGVLTAALVLGLGAASGAEQKEKGTPEAPPNAKAVAGNYYRGDGTGYNIYLTLLKNGTYTAQWRGCLGEYGTASGTWAVTEKRIVLKPVKEKDMMKGHLKVLDVLRYKGQWIFVPSDDRDFYDKYGVSRYSCFQKQEKK